MKDKKEDKKEEKAFPKYRTRFFGFKKKYIAYFLVKSGNTYELLGKRRIRDKGKITLHFNKKPYLVDVGNCSFREGLKDFFLFDLLSGKQLHFEGQETSTIPAEIVDLVVNNNFFKAVLSSIGSRIGFNLNSIITGLAIGGLVGFIIGVMFG